MRLLALLLLALALASPAVQAQGDVPVNDTNETPASNGTAGNQTAGNETDGNETEGNETPPPEPAGPITIELEAHAEGSGGYFTLKGQTERNPRLTFAPGQQVTFVLTIVTGFHNLNVNDEVKTKVMGPGDSETIQWSAPATDGRIDYWCDPHKAAGMRGVFQVGAPSGDGGGDGGGEITGDTIDLGQYDPACEGRVAPASVAEGVVGAPTLQDYIDDCQEETEGEAAPRTGADYVIPASWALIALGVVGVVWVHKYYKP